MSAKLAELFVEIATKNAGLTHGLSQARASITAFSRMAARQLGSIAIGAAAGALGGVGIGGGMIAAAKKAADLGESISKVQVTFGDAAKSMIDQSDQLAERFGTIKRETLDAAAAFGLMGRAAWMSTGDSAALGKEFVQLGLDLASYHNISNQEAFLKLRAGLAGEVEPLRPLGIMLSEDAVKAEALAIGLVKTNRTLTDQEKILGRVALIRRQMGAAIGDLARTEGSTANQLRKMQGELENAAVEFGKKLEGAMIDGIKLAHEFAAVMKSATGKDMADNVGELAKAMVTLGRQTTQGAQGPGGMMVNMFNMLAKSSLLAVVEGMHAAGGGNIPGFTKFRDAMRQKLADEAAKASGAPVPLTGEELRKQLEQAPKDEQAKAIAENNRLRDAQQQQRARENAELNAKIAAEQKAKQDQSNFDFLARARTKIAGALGVEPGQKAEGAQRAMGLLGLLRPGGIASAARGLANQVVGLDKQAGEVVKLQEAAKKPAFQSEQFSGPTEFAQFAIQRALSSEEQPPTKEQIEEAKDRLKEIKEGIDKLLGPLAKIPGMGAILRGQP